MWYNLSFSHSLSTCFTCSSFHFLLTPTTPHFLRFPAHAHFFFTCSQISQQHLHTTCRFCFFLASGKVSPKVVVHRDIEGIRRSACSRRHKRIDGQSSVEDDGKKNVDLEVGILRFMEQSGMPHLFPSQEELMNAGRRDLVEGIIREGGWLAAGWGVDNGARPSRVAKKKGGKKVEPNVDIERSSIKRGSVLSPDFSDVNEPHLFNHHESCIEAKKVSLLTDSRIKGRSMCKGKKLGSKGQGISKAHVKRGSDICHDSPGTHVASIVTPASFTEAHTTVELEGIKLNMQGRNSIEQTSQNQQRREGSKGIEGVESENNVDGSSGWINKMVDDCQEQWIKQAKLKFQGHAQSNATVSITARLRSLESQLLSTRVALRLSRSSLLEGQDKKPKELVGQKQLVELLRALDALEFKEDEILRARRELRTAKAQLTSLEGKMTLEIRDALKALGEKDKALDEAQRVLGQMKLLRIVWPYVASNVLLVGSYDGWTSQIKMEKSSAGVFVAAIRLFPGRYEIKFIVDGQWKVDPRRPIIYNDFHENNLLVVF